MGNSLWLIAFFSYLHEFCSKLPGPKLMYDNKNKIKANWIEISLSQHTIEFGMENYQFKENLLTNYKENSITFYDRYNCQQTNYGEWSNKINLQYYQKFKYIIPDEMYFIPNVNIVTSRKYWFLEKEKSTWSFPLSF